MSPDADVVGRRRVGLHPSIFEISQHDFNTTLDRFRRVSVFVRIQQRSANDRRASNAVANRNLSPHAIDSFVRPRAIVFLNLNELRCRAINQVARFRLVRFLLREDKRAGHQSGNKERFHQLSLSVLAEHNMARPSIHSLNEGSGHG